MCLSLVCRYSKKKTQGSECPILRCFHVSTSLCNRQPVNLPIDLNLVLELFIVLTRGMGRVGEMEAWGMCVVRVLMSSVENVVKIF